MAWITKHSATTKIDRRPEPYFTAAMKQEFTEKVLPRYETKLAALLPALHKVQHEYGWIPAQAMEEIAAFLGLPPSQVLDTASFYEEYWLKPKGRNVIAVCRSIACEFCGQQRITDACREKLGIEVGETTDDGEFTLVEVECLGSCDSAPVALVNEKLFEWLTPVQMQQAIEKAGAERHGHGH
jgi:NADH-quinone oxidoreductase subunit E